LRQKQQSAGKFARNNPIRALRAFSARILRSEFAEPFATVMKKAYF
jgi:hypothetical protein